MLPGARQQIQQFAAEEFMFSGEVGNHADRCLRLELRPTLMGREKSRGVAQLFPRGQGRGSLGLQAVAEFRIQLDHPAPAV